MLPLRSVAQLAVPRVESKLDINNSDSSFDVSAVVSHLARAGRRIGATMLYATAYDVVCHMHGGGVPEKISNLKE